MNKNMTEGNPLSIILKFTLPLFLGNLFQQIYNTVDTMIVGRYLGTQALAAVGSTGTIMFMVIGLSNGMCTGFTVLTSQKFGQGNHEATRKSVANGMMLSMAVVVVMTSIALGFMKQILTWMNTPSDMFADAYAYIMVICAGIVANVGYNYFAACLRAVGNSKVPLYTLMISATLNIILDLLFIRGFHMGTAGAAWATVISQAVSAILCFFYIWKKQEMLMPRWTDFQWNGEYTKAQLVVGLPMALQFGITGSGTVVMQAAINLFGSTAAAAYTASNKITNLLMQGAVALGQTMATYAGQNYGARKLERIKKGVRCALGIDVVYSVSAILIANLALPLLLQLFFDAGADMTEIMKYAREYIILCTSFYIPLSVIFTFRNTMQGCGYGFLPMLGGVVELIARAICAIVAMNTLSFTMACLCDPMAWLAAGVFTMIAYFVVMKDIQKSRIEIS